jgi:hypothetical protein
MLPADIATTATASVQQTFKRIYLMAVDAINDSTALTAQFQRTKKFKAGPDGLYFNAKLETGGAVANVPDGLMLPRSSKPTRYTGKANPAHTYTVIAVGGQSIALTQDTKQAFVSNLEDQLEDGMVRVKLDVERQYNGDARGILAYVETVASAPTYAVQYPFGDIYSTAPGTQLFVEDMDVCFINPASGLERVTRAKVSSIDTAADTITLSASPAAGAIGDYIVLCNDNAATGTDMANNYLLEATGIMAWVKSGDTFENIPGGTYRRWNGVTLSNTGVLRPITEKLIAQGEAKVKARSGRKPDLHYTTPGISIELQDQLAGLRRFSGESSTMKGGYDGLKIGQRTVLEGDFCPKHRWFLLNTDSDVAGMIDLAAMGYVDLDGAKLHRIEGRHAYRADLWFPHNVIVFLRSAHGCISDLEDDVTILR